MTNKPVAAIWARVSTGGQGELSPESQEDRVRQVLEARGFEVPPQYVFKVEWSSMDLMSCPEFQKLQRLISEGKVQAVGTLDRDRFQAQGLQRLVFLSECAERDVEIVTAQGAPMIDGGEGQLVELALALGKERSVLRAQQGARDGLRDRARLKGLPPTTNDFFGFRWDSQQQRFLPNQRYSDAQEIWRLGLSGMSISGIAKELTRRGILTPRGKDHWSTYSVRHILKNRAYAGVVEALKTEAVEPKQRRAGTYGKSGRRVRPESERIPLEGLVEQPIVTDAEYRWMQKLLQQNKQFASKNTKLRSYLLSGQIHCAQCGRSYIGSTVRRRGKTYSYYSCGARWNKSSDGDRCESHNVRADETEKAVFSTVEQFLRGPEGFESEMRRREGISEESELSLRRELENLESQEREELDAESSAFRMASRGAVNDQVYDREIGLIRTRQRWIVEQRDLIESQLADLERYRFDPASLDVLRRRLDARLEGASHKDRRFVLEAVGTKVIVQADGTWELELQVPREAVEPEANDLQIVSSRPESVYTANTRGNDAKPPSPSVCSPRVWESQGRSISKSSQQTSRCGWSRGR